MDIPGGHLADDHHNAIHFPDGEVAGATASQPTFADLLIPRLAVFIGIRRQQLGERAQLHTEHDATERRVTDLHANSRRASN